MEKRIRRRIYLGIKVLEGFVFRVELETKTLDWRKWSKYEKACFYLKQAIFNMRQAISCLD